MFDEEGKFAARKEAKHNFEAGERLSKRKKAKHRNTKTQNQALQQSDAQSRTITERFRPFSHQTESPTNEGVFFPGR